MPVEDNINASKKDSVIIDVRVKAIDGEFLILETLQNNITFRWPLKNLPQPLEVGNSLKLELHNNATDRVYHAAITNKQQAKETEMCNILEKLVN